MVQVTDLRKATSTVRLTRLRRGVQDPERSASFFGWLVGVPAAQTHDGWSIPCANGTLEFVANADQPISIEFAAAAVDASAADPDGVPLLFSRTSAQPRDGQPALDHVSLMCADVAASTQYYQRLGLVVTWSARGDDDRHGVQESPVLGADWVHVSGQDGYLALSQADWKDYGTHTDAAGPPRFIHVGLAVADLTAVEARLSDASTAYLRAPSSGIGERLYLNDPDGDPARGQNVEIVEYAPGVPRSGRLP